jgi:hypothetical protein
MSDIRERFQRKALHQQRELYANNTSNGYVIVKILY